MNAQEILKGLNAQQAEAVKATKGPVLLTAGAGSGKTRTMTRRIAYLIAHDHIDPNNILALTFTRKAADEMAERMASLLDDQKVSQAIMMTTFHGFGAYLLRQYGALNGATEAEQFDIADDTKEELLIARAARQVHLQLNKRRAGAGRPTLKAVKKLIDTCKDELVPADDPQLFNQLIATYDDDTIEALSMMGPGIVTRLYQVYSTYQQILRNDHLYDFGDLIMRSVAVLKSDSMLRAIWQSHYQYINVDEYQDTNYAQFQLLRLLAGKQQNVFAVGDPDQSIYAWRGADIHNILDFKNQFDNARILKLEQNYRSYGNILNAANKVVANNKERMDKNLWTDKDDGFPVTIFKYKEPFVEAKGIARMIKILHHHGIPYRQMAILYRQNNVSGPFETIFHKQNIPYQIIKGLGFYQRSAVKLMLAFFSILVNPYDFDGYREILVQQNNNLGDNYLDLVHQKWEQLTQEAEASDEDNLPTAIEVFKQADTIKGIGPKRAKALIDFANRMDEYRQMLRNRHGAQGLKDFWELLKQKSTYFTFILDSEASDNQSDEPDRKVNQDNLDQLEEIMLNAMEDIDRQIDRERRENISLKIQRAEDDPNMDIGKAYDFAQQKAEFEQQNFKPSIEEIIKQFLMMAKTQADDPLANDANGVNMMTVFAAKGLEFNTVFMPSLVENKLPGYYACQNELEHPAQMEEERRIMYVGMTRAQEHLILSYVKVVSDFGHKNSAQQSRFLREIKADQVHVINYGPTIYNSQVDKSNPFGMDDAFDNYISDERFASALGYNKKQR